MHWNRSYQLLGASVKFPGISVNRSLNSPVYGGSHFLFFDLKGGVWYHAAPLFCAFSSSLHQNALYNLPHWHTQCCFLFSPVTWGSSVHHGDCKPTAAAEHLGPSVKSSLFQRRVCVRPRFLHVQRLKRWITTDCCRKMRENPAVLSPFRPNEMSAYVNHHQSSHWRLYMNNYFFYACVIYIKM